MMLKHKKTTNFVIVVAGNYDDDAESVTGPYDFRSMLKKTNYKPDDFRGHQGGGVPVITYTGASIEQGSYQSDNYGNVNTNY